MGLSTQCSRVEVAVDTATCTERDMNVYASHSLIGEAGIESLFDSLLVEFLTYEDQFLHSVAIDFVPVALQLFVIGKHLTQFPFRHCCIPLTSIPQVHLTASLFKHIAYVTFVFEIADTFGANDIFWPFTRNKIVKHAYFKGFTCIIDVCAYAIFLCLSFAIMVMVVMTSAMTIFIMVMMLMTVWTFFIIVIVVVRVFMMRFMMVMMLVFMLFIFLLILLFLMRISLNFLNPLCRKSHRVEVKVARIEHLVEINIAEVAIDDLGLWLDSLDDLAYSAQFLLANL